MRREIAFGMNLKINQTQERSELLSTAISWLQQGKRIALITLVEIEGNAPYPVGTQMLVDEKGNFKGQITGGCAETAIALQAVDIIRSGQNKVQRYGLGSPFFDIQLPCGSGIDVFFDVNTSLEEYSNLHRKTLGRREVSQRLLEGTQSFTKTYQPNRRLMVFGQGPIVTALSKMAQQVGYEVVCIAQNSETQQELDRLKLVSTLLGESREFTALCDEYTALVSLFHEHEHETDILKTAICTPLFYIGALGSKRTHQARLDSLSSAGVAESQLSRIIGPVGTDIGAITPMQIAVSIMSQLIEVANRTEHGA